MSSRGVASEINPLGVKTIPIGVVNQMADRRGNIFGLSRMTMRGRQPVTHQRHRDPVAY